MVEEGVSLIPAITLDIDLALVTDTMSNFLSAYWLPAAFAVGIALSFYVLHQIKGLFLR